MNVLVLGANGYTGARLVQELISRGHRVRGLVRELDKSAPLEALGMEVRVGDVGDLESIRTIALDIEIIFYLIAYCRTEPVATRLALSDGTRHLVQIVDREHLQKCIFVSNLAIYGHPRTGERLDESTLPKPDYALGRLTLETEKLLRRELPTVTVRVSNIYGPGRDQIEAIRRGGIRLLNGGENWQSRIHVDDLVQVLLAAMEKGGLGQVYLASDDLPMMAKDFYGELAEALHVAPPLNLEVTAARAFGGLTRALNWLSASQQYQLNENVIGLLTGNYYCVNDRIKEELGVKLKYPTFRDAYEEWLTAGSASNGVGSF